MEKLVSVFEGRLTFINSIMDGQPTYMMSLFSLPDSIEKKINKARRYFLWQGNKEKKGYNVVKWDIAAHLETTFPYLHILRLQQIG